MGIARTVAILAITAGALAAQCVMCFRTAETQNAARARALNQGILVMAVPPILFIAGILVWARHRGAA